MLNQFLTKVGFLKPLIPSFSLTVALGAGASFAHVALEKVSPKNALNNFKRFVVKNTPTKVFVHVASVLPIGNWLEYDTAERLEENALGWAVEQDDVAYLDKILKSIPKQTLYKLLLDKNWLQTTPLHIATGIFNDKKRIFMQKIILAIEPHMRCSLLKSVTNRLSPYMFHVMAGIKSVPDIDFILSNIPEQDKWEFISQIDKDGDSLLTYLGIQGGKIDQVKVLLKHVPSEKLMEFLSICNKKGNTALIYFSYCKSELGLDHILSLVPKDKLQELFAYQNQGQRALEYAYSGNSKKRSVAVLNKYGLFLPKGYKPRNIEELRKSEQIMHAQEKFKEKVGDYPQDILGLVGVFHSKEIAKAAYKGKVLESHPDKGVAKDNAAFHKVQAAYEFFVDEDKRNSYLKVQ